MRAQQYLLIFSICSLVLLSFLLADVKVFNVTFYVTNTPGGQEVTRFVRGDTVYVYAVPPPEGSTLVIEVQLIYPPEAGRSPLVLLSRRTVNMQGTTLLATYNIQAQDPEGTYAVRLVIMNPATNERADRDLSFEVKSAIPWELIIAGTIIAVAAGAAGFIVYRRRKSVQPQLVQPPPATPETQVAQIPALAAQPTAVVRLPTGETVTLAARFEYEGKSIPIIRIPQEFGRSDFLNIAPRDVLNAISRRHFMIDYSYAEGTFYIQDIGSTNGTYVNGVDIRGKGRVPLRDGDKVNVAGVLELTFVALPSGSSGMISSSSAG